jgi:hypothetical protein
MVIATWEAPLDTGATPAALLAPVSAALDELALDELALLAQALRAAASAAARPAAASAR